MIDSMTHRRSIWIRLLTIGAMAMTPLLPGQAHAQEPVEGCPNGFFVPTQIEDDPADINGNGITCAHTLIAHQVDDRSPTHGQPPGTPVAPLHGPFFGCNAPTGGCYNAHGGVGPDIPLGPASGVPPVGPLPNS
jgi:hypothetical protein